VYALLISPNACFLGMGGSNFSWSVFNEMNRSSFSGETTVRNVRVRDYDPIPMSVEMPTLEP
jgi:hypothetical protein